MTIPTPSKDRLTAPDTPPGPAVQFQAGGLAARELAAQEVPLLQALFDANPLYFQAVNGRPPHPDEAQEEFDELPPPHLPYTRRWFLGLFDAQADSDALQGVAVVVQDLCAPGVWHVALYLLASALHGGGAASAVYRAMEAWMRDGGARWLRLGVVAGNARAERFWQARGFVEIRRRKGVDTGGRVNDVRVLTKPLAGGTLGEYLLLVPRDRPDSALP
jgi:GNAT superfamily N-acetyltransferase